MKKSSRFSFMEYPSAVFFTVHSFIFLTTSFSNGMKLPAFM